jgi:hypothetical protein
MAEVEKRIVVHLKDKFKIMMSFYHTKCGIMLQGKDNRIECLPSLKLGKDMEKITAKLVLDKQIKNVVEIMKKKNKRMGRERVCSWIQ